MAKPTDEPITLADFDSALVKKENDTIQVKNISLQDLHKQSDRGLIVYFYPKDNTSGCTTQAQDFTAFLGEFNQLGYDIVGVSRDSIQSHEKFIDSKALDIGLISDPDETLCQYFDVIKEKNMYGKKVLGLVRSTFVFNKRGQLTHAQRNLRAKGYAERLLATLSD